jgi:hypothetical protein
LPALAANLGRTRSGADWLVFASIITTPPQSTPTKIPRPAPSREQSLVIGIALHGDPRAAPAGDASIPE